ncbi:hypothetical protein HBI18_224940 [Parastagonospora nodorum]|nr:hypothetical protein HBI12_211870 [Parastagonospora nodorum]KAH5710437.1 hypothetical protein HBI18_224940 [Parastagonospora nodorum]KAH6139807.1 hypothetical protein HBI68_221630 [Parastagonospora nodorum]KAH6323758.1 hypothetical protein HBI37_225520 [Parastagonospora nodorum]KAH6336478.1 hypothetical protein HBI36_223030 [Parastagonospora nodorum]
MPKARPVQLPIADRMAYITLTPCFDIGTEDAGLSSIDLLNIVNQTHVQHCQKRSLVATGAGSFTTRFHFMFLLASGAYTRKQLALLIPAAIFRRAKNAVIVEANASTYQKTLSTPPSQSIGQSLAFCRSPWPPVIVGSGHHIQTHNATTGPRHVIRSGMQDEETLR